MVATSALDTLWILLGATLVFFMQAGFAMVETGFTRAKNAGNIIMKNLMDFACGSIVYLLLGFGLMYGSSELIGGFVGTVTPMLAFDSDWVSLFFQTVFCATSATIVSGAMGERTKFSAYLAYSIAISAVVYPISGHWIWGGGWLSTLGTPGGMLSSLSSYGFHDFAGSTAVHMVGGLSALIGAKILGPRIGKYDEDGRPKAIPGHSITLGALGVFILWFGWFGFNPASSLAIDGMVNNVSRIFVTTNTAAAVSTTVVMIITWIKYRKPDVSMTLNGSLGGLVAITAGCSTVTVTGSIFIGVIAGFTVVYGIELIDRKLKIDDPVGAVGVHCLCGAMGTVLVGVFSYYDPYTDMELLTPANGLGLIYGGGAGQLVTQLIGVLAVAVWVSAAMVILFHIIKATLGLRVDAHEEIVGLDIEEHGLASAYADFMPAVAALAAEGGMGDEAALPADEPPAAAVPVERYTAAAPSAPGGHKLTKVVIVCNPVRFEAIKAAMNSIGVTGMTVTQVLGCGIQKGAEASFYRGVEMDITLIRKIKIEIVVSKVPVRQVVDTARKVLYTGSIGDGKIFVYDVENVIRVRTGDEGYDALQGEN